jgi:hypothetical protein
LGAILALKKASPTRPWCFVSKGHHLRIKASIAGHYQ